MATDSRLLFLVGCLLLGCGGGNIQIPASMLHSNTPASSSSASSNGSWYATPPSSLDDGLVHLTVDRKSDEGTLFDAAMKKRHIMIQAGWKARKDRMTGQPPYYQFQATKDEIQVWITLFATGKEMMVMECGGLKEDAAHNQPICDAAVKKFQALK